MKRANHRILKDQRSSFVSLDESLTVMFVPSDCFNKRSNWWRIVFTTMTSFITWRYDSMSMASCSPSSSGGSAVNGGLSETQRVNDLLKKNIFFKFELQCSEQKSTYRRWSGSAVLSTRWLSRLSSSSDSRRLLGLFSIFEHLATVAERCVLGARWDEGLAAGWWDAPDKEFDEHEPVCSLKLEHRGRTNVHRCILFIILLFARRVQG